MRHVATDTATRNTNQYSVLLGVILTSTIFFGLYRALLAYANPQQWPDSERYRSVTNNVFDYFSGYGPGQLVQIINLLPLESAVAMQAFLATVLCGYAVYLVAKHNTSKAVYLFVPIIGVLLWSPWITLWDNHVLTESITVAGIIVFAVGTGTIDYIGMLVGLVVTLLTRPLMVPLFLVVFLIISVYGIIKKKHLFGWHRTQFSIIIFMLIFASLQTITFNTAKVQFEWMERPASIQAVQAADRLLGRMDIESTLENARRYGLPQPEVCTLPEGRYRFADVWTEQAEKNCPGLHAFLDNGGAPWYSDLINDPFSMGKRLSEIVYTERIAYTFYDTREVPDRISYAIDLAMWFIILFSIVSSLLLFNKHWIMRNIILFCAVGYAIALWAVDGQEVWRHMLPCLIFIPFHYLGYLSKKVVIE